MMCFYRAYFLRLTRQEIGICCIAAEVDERIRAAVWAGGDEYLSSICLQGDRATVKQSRLRKVDQRTLENEQGGA